MTASERSYVGLAKQTAAGTPNTTDGEFQYFLFTEGALAPSNVFLPLDQEVGGGAMQRSIVKVGVTSAGQLAFIPRPQMIGHLLYGALGSAAAPDDRSGVLTAARDHAFTLPTDQFDAPYFTVRSAPGGIFAEQFQDMRVAALSLEWRAANFLRGSMGFMGGLPTPGLSMGTWNAQSQLDAGAQFLAPVSTIEVPTGSPVKVLSGVFTAGLAIPLDEQWITGSYSPDAFDINARAFALSLNVKVTDSVLYDKINYDPDGGAAWAAKVFKEGDINVVFNSDTEIETGVPHALKIEANGASGADANVAWTATPIALRAGRQVVMNITGTFLADLLAGDPITVTLTNDQITQY